LALDELKENDDVYEIDDFKYIVDKNLLKVLKSVKIDFQDYNFKITSGLGFSSGCDSCSTCG